MTPPRTPEPTDRFFTADGQLDADALWADTQQLVADLFGTIELAEEEAAKAAGEHPDAADLLYHAVPLTRPTWDEPRTEWLIRAHVRELLDRAATGADLRPGTDAEVCVASMRASLEAPLTEVATGLYGRCFSRIRPDGALDVWADALPHEEALHGAEIDDLERRLREQIGRRVAAAGIDRRLFDGRGRPLPTIACEGRHHGEPAPSCRFARPEQATLESEDA